MTTHRDTAWSQQGVADAGAAWTVIRQVLLTKPVGAIGAAIVVVLVLTVLLADVLAPYDAYEINGDAQFAPPSAAHWLGADEFGRDILTRILYGTRSGLPIAFIAALLGAISGVGVGNIIASVWRRPARWGRRDATRIRRWVRSMRRGWWLYPLQILLAVAISTALGRSFLTWILASALPLLPHVALIVRDTAWARPQSVHGEVNRVVGWDLRGLFVPLLIAQIGRALLLAEALSSIGLGANEPTPSWGLMLGGAKIYADQAPWLSIVPYLAIILAVFGFSTFGSALHDIIDPAAATVRKRKPGAE